MIEDNKEEVVMDVDEFEDVFADIELPEIDMTTYDQADNENNGCTGGGCAI